MHSCVLQTYSYACKLHLHGFKKHFHAFKLERLFAKCNDMLPEHICIRLKYLWMLSESIPMLSKHIPILLKNISIVSMYIRILVYIGAFYIVILF